MKPWPGVENKRSQRSVAVFGGTYGHKVNSFQKKKGWQMSDFFLSKKEQLKRWMQSRGIFATHEVIEWGTHNFYNRAAQTKGDLIREGFLIKLGVFEKLDAGYKCKDEVYKWCPASIAPSLSSC
jgi:hypothetical protein